MQQLTDCASKTPTTGSEEVIFSGTKKSHRNHIIPYDIVSGHDTPPQKERSPAGSGCSSPTRILLSNTPPSRTGRALCLSGRHTAASRTMVHKSVQLGCWMQRTRMLGCIGLFVSVLPVPHWTEVFLLLNAPYKMEAEIGSFDILSWLRLLPCATRLSRNASCRLF